MRGWMHGDQSKPAPAQPVDFIISINLFQTSKSELVLKWMEPNYRRVRRNMNTQNATNGFIQSVQDVMSWWHDDMHNQTTVVTVTGHSNSYSIDVKNVFYFFIPVTFLRFLTFLFCQRFLFKKAFIENSINKFEKHLIWTHRNKLIGLDYIMKVAGCRHDCCDVMQ